MQFVLKQVARASALLAVGLSTVHVASVHADAPAGLAAAMGITSADGTVRTQAGVHLSLVAPRENDSTRIESARGALRARMPEVRRCFSEAMIRSADADGILVVTLVTQARGRVDAKLKSNPSGDAVMGECMRSALSQASLRNLPLGTELEATLTIDNPVARLRKRQAQRSVLEGVRMLGGGMAQSEGGTQAREVAYRVVGSAYASHTIGGLNKEFQTRLPGLLDCRRKASRKWKAAEGSLELDILIEAGRIARVKTKSNSMNDRRAQTCIGTWLSRVDTSQLASAEVDVTVSFAR